MTRPSSSSVAPPGPPRRPARIGPIGAPSRCAAVAGLVALQIACSAGAVQAQSWGAPSEDQRRYGIRAIVCDRRDHATPCLAVACDRGKLSLVNLAGGGGPMDGPTRVSAGPRAFTARFQFDPRAIDRLGLAASRADLTADQWAALEGAKTLVLTAPSDGRIRFEFTTRGFADRFRRVSAACG